LARKAKDSIAIWFLCWASSLSPGMPSTARKMSADGPPAWLVSNGEPPVVPPEVSVPDPESPGGPGSPCGPGGPAGPCWLQVSVASPALQVCAGVASVSMTRSAPTVAPPVARHAVMTPLDDGMAAIATAAPAPSTTAVGNASLKSRLLLMGPPLDDLPD
jgi:hypothetical protein